MKICSLKRGKCFAELAMKLDFMELVDDWGEACHHSWDAYDETKCFGKSIG